MITTREDWTENCSRSFQSSQKLIHFSALEIDSVLLKTENQFREFTNPRMGTDLIAWLSAGP